MISVNSVRNAVMFLLEKNNRGFLKPEAFDSFCGIAQIDILEGLFTEYTAWLTKKNRNISHNEYGDISKNIQEIIDIFSTYTTNANFTYDNVNDLWSYTGNDLYRTEGLSLVQTTGGKKVDIELVNKTEFNRQANSNLIAPSLTYPIYTKIGTSYRVSPKVPTGYTTEMFYLRTPKAPKWSYVVAGGNPVYNGSASDLQDIELPSSLYNRVVVKVLGYAGLSIREEQVMQAANVEHTQTYQKQNS